MSKSNAPTLYDWPKVAKQSPHEIKLTGEQAKQQIEKDGGELSELVYKIKSLNFLEVTNSTNLVSISSNISLLSGLTNLVLQGNKLTSVPVDLAKLTKLKCLDLSRNEIASLPEGIFDQMSSLQTLNLEQNQLISLPNMSKLSSLARLLVGSNQLAVFPESLCSRIYRKVDISNESPIPIYDGGAVHLSEFHASHNLIEDLPASIGNLAALKTLDLSYNKIVIIPKELADCGKLKEVNLKVNPVKDRRLGKLIEQCPTKKILEYVRASCPSLKAVPEVADQTPGAPSNATGDNKKGDDRKKCKIIVQKPLGEVFKILVTPTGLKQRKIVGCIVHNVDLSNPKVLRKFLALQTTMHKNICEDRQKATIATHDLAKVIAPEASWAEKMTKSGETLPTPDGSRRVAHWDGKVPTKISLVPLGRKEMTAMELYRALNEEADAYRKLKKRETISGIHRYIHLLKGKQYFPVLSDCVGNVISLPPLTNSENTKISATTTDIFVEVTGDSIPTLREVMNELIGSLFKVTVEPDADDADDPDLVAPNNSLVKKAKGEEGAAAGTLLLEPVVAVTAETGQLLIKYPAHIDLQFDGIDVEYH